MSKYADIEEIKKVIREEWVKYMPSGLDINLSFVLGKIAEVPTIEVSEDCISREYLLSKVYDMDNDNLVVDLKDIENAPSVVPSRAEGEWIMHVDYLFPCESTQECSVCHSQHLICGNDDNYCPYCGAKMKG